MATVLCPMRPLKKSRTPEHVSGGETPKPRFRWPDILQDIQAEIYAYLTPKDLVNLSRVDKDTYGYFRCAHTDIYWQRARRNVPGLPPCPAWLSEAQFASLCFEEHCQRCLATDDHSKTPIWPFYTRYCAQCNTACTTTVNPFQGLQAGRYQRLYGGDVARMLPSVRRELVTDDEESVLVTAFHVPDVIKFRSALLKASMSERAVIVSDWYASTIGRNYHAEHCHTWKLNADEAERERLERIRLQRYRSIHDKLAMLGYKEELMNLGVGLQGLPEMTYAFFKKPQPLAEDEWTTYLPKLKEFLDTRRTLENRRTHVRAMLARLKIIDAVQHMIEVHDMAPITWIPVCSEISGHVKNLEYAEQGLAHAESLRVRWTCVQCSWPESRAAYDFGQLQEHFVQSHPLVTPHSKWYNQSCDSMNPPVIVHGADLQEDALNDILDDMDFPLDDVYITSMQFPKDAWCAWPRERLR
ncbi:hypothetical protein C8Q76DRAFT_803966 [Earliella scabrosa]|nr:hypothetical protein C8Q76DRAFT_803966 [Earliella scabrosa]